MTTTARQKALRFVVSLGLVSLFADFTYEGGRSIVGPFLASLGASAVFAGAVAGIGEFLGYAVRLFSGRLVDRTHKDWLILTVGYVVNLVSVPLLALAPTSVVAGALVFGERFGKGIRAPARNALLSKAGKELGHGKAFGLHQLLDQIGAVVGPLVVSAAVVYSGYRLGFGVLVIPAALALIFLWRARGIGNAEAKAATDADHRKFDKRYYLYLAFSVVTVLGFAHNILYSYHLEYTHRLSAAAIPLLFAFTMGVDAVAAFACGWLYDKYGLKVLMLLPLFTVPATPLLFLAPSPGLIWLGGGLWGAAMGLQDATMRSGVATLTPESVRGTAYGVFDTVFGISWLIGSVLLGWLYGLSPLALVIAAVVFQIAALPLLWLTLRTGKTA
ncbi:MAG TPA: MFS transporter [Gammaproteobacteria bacterium]|nr:MFS transporter [Gammaproteobacteria bacterium]